MMNTKEETVFAIDIGGTHTKIGLVNEKGEILEHRRFPTQAKSPFTDFLSTLKIHFDELIIKKGHSPIGIGIGAPNANHLTGKMIAPPNFDWQEVHLKKEINLTFKLPTEIDNDANIAALGEKLFGKGKNLENFMVVTLGTGVGTGLILNNSLFRGDDGLAGEGGHIIIETNGRPCPCGGEGHLESYGGVKGIEDIYTSIGPDTKQFTDLRDDYLNGTSQAIKTIEKYTDYLATGLATMNNLINFQGIYLTGGITSLGENFLNTLRPKYKKLIFKNFSHRYELDFCQTPYKYGSLHGAFGLINKESL